MNNNKMYLDYNEIRIVLLPGDDLFETVDRAGYDFEGTHVGTVTILDREIYKIPAILMGNRVFYNDDIIKQYYQDVSDVKSPDEINNKIRNYAISHLSTNQTLGRNKK